MKELLVRGYFSTGIDGSKEMLKLAKKNLLAGSFILEDIRLFNLKSTFHAAISISVLLHIMTIDDLTKVF